jgi:hypothetical protein
LKTRRSFKAWTISTAIYGYRLWFLLYCFFWTDLFRRRRQCGTVAGLLMKHTTVTLFGAICPLLQNSPKRQNCKTGQDRGKVYNGVKHIQLNLTSARQYPKKKRKKNPSGQKRRLVAPESSPSRFTTISIGICQPCDIANTSSIGSTYRTHEHIHTSCREFPTAY